MRNIYSSHEKQASVPEHVHRSISQNITQYSLGIRKFFTHLLCSRDQTEDYTGSGAYVSHSPPLPDQSLDPQTECPIAKKLFWDWLTPEKINEYQNQWIVFTKEGFLDAKETYREARSSAESKGMSSEQCYYYKIDKDYIQDIYSVFPERKAKEIKGSQR